MEERITNNAKKGGGFMGGGGEGEGMTIRSEKLPPRRLDSRKASAVARILGGGKRPLQGEAKLACYENF